MNRIKRKSLKGKESRGMYTEPRGTNLSGTHKIERNKEQPTHISGIKRKSHKEEKSRGTNLRGAPAKVRGTKTYQSTSTGSRGNHTRIKPQEEHVQKFKSLPPTRRKRTD